MTSLLPPNATDFEKILENATKFGTDAGLLNGFKFKENQGNQAIIGYLIWEFSLNDVLKYIQNSDDIVADGLVFQRTRGTREAVKIAANWADLNDVDVYEEEPSSHFYEFQIGVKNRQFDFDIELLKNVIGLAKPVRSRLSRVYNDVYDVRYFKLDGGSFGESQHLENPRDQEHYRRDLQAGFHDSRRDGAGYQRHRNRIPKSQGIRKYGL
jgi:P2-related tail formation protein